MANESHHPESLRPSGYRSRGEEIVASILEKHGIRFEYEREIEIDGWALCPDFYLPDFGFFVEFWGTTGSALYSSHRHFKRQLYQANNLPLIELWPVRPQEIHSKWEYKLLVKLGLAKGQY